MNKATKDELEILGILQEECGEVICAVSKTRRFGWDSCHPDVPNYCNREHLETEVGDLLALVKIMCDKGIISETEIARCAEQKIAKLKKFSNIKGL